VLAKLSAHKGTSMRSVLSACRILARSGKILLEEMIWRLCGPTARPVARSVVYVYVDPPGRTAPDEPSTRGSRERLMMRCGERH